MKRLYVYVTLLEGLQVMLFAAGASTLYEFFEPAINVSRFLASAVSASVLLLLVSFFYMKLFFDTSKKQS